MKGSRFSEEQIFGVLNERGLGPRRLTTAAGTGSQRRPFMNESPNMSALRCLTRSG